MKNVSADRPKCPSVLSQLSLNWPAFAGQSASVVLLLCAMLLWTGCERQETVIRLTSSERIRIDSLAKKQIDSLVPILDSICTANKDTLIRQALDSIINLRREEENILRERIKQKQQ